MGATGDSASFEFASRWDLSTGREAVWDALVDFHQWPVWWPALENLTETIQGDADGIGQQAVAVWRGPFGYSLRVEVEAVERVPTEYLRGVATGDVAGDGIWRLGTDGDGWTSVEFDWNVRATKRWMVALAPVARPAFVAGHDQVVRQGAEGLADYLSCDLRDFSATVR